MKAYVLAAAAVVTVLASAALVGRTAQAQASGSTYLGEIITVPYNFCPMGWVSPQGQLLPINQNTALFSLLGTTYGGDGRTTFALPHLTPIHSQNRAPLMYCMAVQGVWPSRP